MVFHFAEMISERQQIDIGMGYQEFKLELPQVPRLRLKVFHNITVTNFLPDTSSNQSYQWYSWFPTRWLSNKGFVLSSLPPDFVGNPWQMGRTGQCRHHRCCLCHRCCSCWCCCYHNPCIFNFTAITLWPVWLCQAYVVHNLLFLGGLIWSIALPHRSHHHPLFSHLTLWIIKASSWWLTTRGLQS